MIGSFLADKSAMVLICGIVVITLGTTGLVAATSDEDSNDNGVEIDGQEDFIIYENSCDT